MDAEFDYLIVSDSHLRDGFDNPTEGLYHFDEEFAGFLRYYRLNRASDHPWRLIIAGDFIEFLYITDMPGPDEPLTGQVRLALIIPKGFSERLADQQQTTFPLFVDGTMPTLAQAALYGARVLSSDEASEALAAVRLPSAGAGRAPGHVQLSSTEAMTTSKPERLKP